MPRTKGLEVADAISGVATAAGSKPVEAVTITSIRLVSPALEDLYE